LVKSDHATQREPGDTGAIRFFRRRSRGIAGRGTLDREVVIAPFRSLKPRVSGGRSRVGALGVALALSIAGVLPRSALAHEGAPPAPHDLWTAWTFDPFVLVSLLLAAALYARGRARLGRPGRLLGSGRAVAFWIGLAALALALISPLAALGSALFAAHMTQHLVLVLLAAPLILLGRPAVVWLWAFDIGRRRGWGRWWKRGMLPRLIRPVAGRPAIAWTLHVATIWIWHLPLLYQAALADEALHALEHLLFTGTALAFWWPVLPVLGRPRLGYGGAVLYLFAAGMQSTLLGVLMTFSRVPWYGAYGDTAPLWGLSPIADQQLAGLIMWIPAAASYSIAAVGLILVWLGEEDRHASHPAGRARAGPFLRQETALDERPHSG
jgi:cytochrome c oxidase assembly factor CtaG